MPQYQLLERQSDLLVNKENLNQDGNCFSFGFAGKALGLQAVKGTISNKNSIFLSEICFHIKF